MRSYSAIIHKDAASDYGVSFPDFPGCVSAGATLDEARDNAVEALALHIEGMVADGLAIPAPSSLDAVMQDATARAGVAVLVAAPDAADPVVRVNITMAASDLAKIDAGAEAAGMTRSAYLVRSATSGVAAGGLAKATPRRSRAKA